MKQLKWDPILMSPNEKQKALDPEKTFLRELARIKLIACEFQEIYYSMCDDDEQDDSWFSSLSSEILDFGDVMIKAGVTPGLIQLQVPFVVRRQLYEQSAAVENAIYGALNSKDRYFNKWIDQMPAERAENASNKAQLAQALWKWYYTVFEPIATRFVQVGSEHHINSLR